MKESSSASKDVRKRPKTPQDFSLLRALRYEDAANGNPPVVVASINPPKAPSSANSAAATVTEQVNTSRPRTAPSPGPRTPPSKLPFEAKRDSGIAPSLSTTGRTSYAESNISSALGAAKEPSLPTILVQDDEPPATATEKSRLPFGKRQSKSKRRSQSMPRGVRRMNSFKGIQSEIPSGELGSFDFDLEDLASDKVEFSKRGSLLFGGKKMNQMVESQGRDAARSDGVTTPVGTRPDETTKAEGGGSQNEEVTEVPKQGLVAGRRKPSVHMLQAAIEGGRVLSAEEMTFSMKVRSMYEHGDERGADWTQNSTNGSSTLTPSENLATESSTPDASIDSIIVSNTRKQRDDAYNAQRSRTPDLRVSYYREPTELAGGVEDWEDVDGKDVDRYGFINPKRPSSGTTAGSQEPTPGIQRVATALRVEADQPRGSRKLRRGPSVATRTSQSVPSSSNREDAKTMRSFKSQRSIGPLHSGNPFRSKDRKSLAEASDMLTLPPGLADIAEEQDAGRTASIAKRREWEREAKWQKMARPVRGKSEGVTNAQQLGGGMNFEFDTNDQKLVSRTWKGIPDRWRATAWHSFLSSSAKRRGIGASDEELTTQYYALQEKGSADDVQIDVDVPRTIRMHIMFRRRYRGGQRLLFRVLHAISLYSPDTGYVQGMASLAATLLCYYDEEKAFVMMVRLWELRGLEQLFQSGFGGLMNALNEFERDWLRNGDVAKKLEELGITSTAYGTRWYLTLFNMSIPFPAQLRVWDAFMLLGDAPTAQGKDFGGADLDVLHATSAALVDATREILLDSDFENAMKVLTSFIPVKDEDLLMRVTRTEWKMRKKRGSAKA